jgi:hypothetical protein
MVVMTAAPQSQSQNAFKPNSSPISHTDRQIFHPSLGVAAGKPARQAVHDKGVKPQQPHPSELKVRIDLWILKTVVARYPKANRF